MAHQEETRGYRVPDDPLIRERLSWFQDQKLALMVHWGPYSQLGTYESWPLSDADADWSRKHVTWEKDSATFRKQYTDLNKTFNPLRFAPEEWADFAVRAGCKYLIFTTKHHDGFCMFDSAQTDYKITGADCPYHENRNADVARVLFDAFRARGIGIAAYFSKPDWHCPWYWAEGQEKPVACDRNPTYDPKENPALWDAFTRYTHAQLMELVRDYGRLEILWLDGGQVRPSGGQDIRLSELMARAREIQPWLLCADRTVGGENENYVTPEQQVPSEPLGVPWESCISVGTGFSYRYDDDFKSPRALAKLLISVVSRGGNLALDLGGQPDGRLPRHGMENMLALGAWLSENGDAIYATRVCAPYERDGWYFTQKPGKRYALFPLAEDAPVPRTLRVPAEIAFARAYLTNGGTLLPVTRGVSGACVALPECLGAERPLAIAVTLEE